ncbi:unnamed protein product [Schistocephalus solidus]|uniref:WASH-7_N domain-containing protein n=1 Tax=Schistocephalus solidus TaxID=70667 RepID=A0A183TDA7_SCHSO|nr:unnamed protein product [Schistocephalus solidus]
MRICGRFQSFVLQRLAFDDSLSSERATELISQSQGIDSLVNNLPLPQTPIIWFKVFPEGRLPCGCSFSLTPIFSEPTNIASEPSAQTEDENQTAGSFAEAFKHTLIDCIVDLLSIPVQAFPEGLLLFFNKLDQLVQAKGSTLSCFRFLGDYAVIHFLLLAFWWKIGSLAPEGRQKQETGIGTDASDPLRPQKLVIFAIIAHMMDSEVQPAFEDLLKVHAFLKTNASWLQSQLLNGEGEGSVKAVGDGPVLSVGSAADLRQRLQLPKFPDVSELDWDAVCKLNVGLSPATLGHLLSLRGEDGVQPLLSIINKHCAAAVLP